MSSDDPADQLFEAVESGACEKVERVLLNFSRDPKELVSRAPRCQVSRLFVFGKGE